jgi:hypothetical protein
LTVQLPLDIHNMLLLMAADEDRSLSNMVARCIRIGHRVIKEEAGSDEPE